MAFSEEIERVRGVSGELALRRGPAGLEIVANGVFLVSAANAASSRALVGAAWPRVAGDSSMFSSADSASATRWMRHSGARASPSSPSPSSSPP